PLIGRLLLYDALQMSFQEFKVRRNPKCPMCGDKPTITQLIDYEQFCGMRGQATQTMAPSQMAETTVEELKARLDRGDKVFILDVRNPEEFQICRIPGSTFLPLPQLPQRFSELPKDTEMVVHCKSGMRSAKAIMFLKQQGFQKLSNLKGGIMAWADRIDRTMAKY
ncbi:MAG TPA: rhodanese-like domain-containing protein, partial [Gemmataceae bacterium]|nr:rhodanese-like domain-containing protein [Gemmataceae bacterium]